MDIWKIEFRWCCCCIGNCYALEEYFLCKLILLVVVYFVFILTLDGSFHNNVEVEINNALRKQATTVS